MLFHSVLKEMHHFDSWLVHHLSGDVYLTDNYDHILLLEQEHQALRGDWQVSFESPGEWV